MILVKVLLRGYDYFYTMPTPFNQRKILIYIQAVILIVGALYFAKPLLVPMSYGLLVAVVLFPLCKKLERKGFPRAISISVALLSVTILITILFALLIVEINLFNYDLPVLRQKITDGLPYFQKWLSKAIGISMQSQSSWWENAVYNLISNPAEIIKNALTATAETFVTLFLIPIYAALFLYNRTVFVRFLVSITPSVHRGLLPHILEKATSTYSKFIKGMVFVYLIVGTLNSIGFLLLGIKHAVLFGILTALMTIIPYVGIIISSLLPITVAWLTNDSIWYPVGVIVILSVVQYLEANVIFPKVVGTQLNISTWATLVAAIAGGLLWGISGMILFIPFVGILKIILEQFPAGRIFNILLARNEKDVQE
jgi:predicted PurR-regulated permease PerM